MCMVEHSQMRASVTKDILSQNRGIYTQSVGKFIVI